MIPTRGRSIVTACRDKKHLEISSCERIDNHIAWFISLVCLRPIVLRKWLQVLCRCPFPFYVLPLYQYPSPSLLCSSLTSYFFNFLPNGKQSFHLGVYVITLIPTPPPQLSRTKHVPIQNTNKNLTRSNIFDNLIWRSSTWSACRTVSLFESCNSGSDSWRYLQSSCWTYDRLPGDTHLPPPPASPQPNRLPGNDCFVI